MTSTLGYVLLSLLARRPMTGYDLARRMDRPVGWFWTAGHSQIYPELARLEATALVEHTEVPGAGPRQTKRYSATAAGVEALRSWVTSDLESPPARDLETLRLWSVWAVDPEQARGLVRQLRAAHLERLTAYEDQLAQIEDQDSAHDRSHPDFASRLTLVGGVRSRRTMVDWLTWVEGELGDRGR